MDIKTWLSQYVTPETDMTWADGLTLAEAWQACPRAEWRRLIADAALKASLAPHEAVYQKATAAAKAALDAARPESRQIHIGGPPAPAWVAFEAATEQPLAELRAAANPIYAAYFASVSVPASGVGIGPCPVWPGME